MAITKSTLEAKGIQISVQTNNEKTDYISLTDLAKFKNPDFAADVVKNWMRLKNTVEYLGVWEKFNNPNFKLVGFDQFKNDAGSNGFVLSPQKWIRETNAIGIVSKSGKYGGGTFAHSDIAFKFASWLSVEFELYVVKEFQRLKKNETHKLQLEWSAKRELSKVNYKIHTDAVKEYLIPENLTKQQINYKYANEADLLNMALFGMTASQWREDNPSVGGNIRDNANVCQLIVLINMENMNAELIKQKISASQRLIYLRKMATEQMESISDNAAVKRLEKTILQEPPKFDT